MGYHHAKDSDYCQTRRGAVVQAGPASRSVTTVPTTVSHAQAHLPHTLLYQTPTLDPNYGVYAGHHPADPLHQQVAAGVNGAEPVVIGAEVCIGGNVRILPGCIIGQGSAVEAGSVVTSVSDPPPKHAQLLTDGMQFFRTFLHLALSRGTLPESWAIGIFVHETIL
ncbi:MAG: hypothetical protein ACRERD_06490 [Candidatus Binatia bacterium]